MHFYALLWGVKSICKVYVPFYKKKTELLTIEKGCKLLVDVNKGHLFQNFNTSVQKCVEIREQGKV